MARQIMFLLFVTMLSQVLAQGALMEWFKTSVGKVQEGAENVWKCAKTPGDFTKFGDKSKQTQRNFTLSEVQQCDGRDGHCLYIIYDKNMVLDLTEFADYHCGGRKVLEDVAGTDATEKVFRSGMPLQLFRRLLRIFQVGNLINDSGSVIKSESCAWWANLAGLC